MKIVGQILLACALLVALQSLLAVAVVLLCIGLLWGAFFRPAATFNLLFSILLLGVAAEQPKAFIIMVGIVLVMLALTRRGGRRHGRPFTRPLALPTPPRGGVWRAGGHEVAGDG